MSESSLSFATFDQIVDSTAGCELLSFLDAYSGYHQIKMKESNQLATSFITPFGMYCYVTMPFGLKRRDYIPAMYAPRVRGPYQAERRSICR